MEKNNIKEQCYEELDKLKKKKIISGALIGVGIIGLVIARNINAAAIMDAMTVTSGGMVDASKFLPLAVVSSFLIVIDGINLGRYFKRTTDVKNKIKEEEEKENEEEASKEQEKTKAKAKTTQNQQQQAKRVTPPLPQQATRQTPPLPEQKSTSYYGEYFQNMTTEEKIEFLAREKEFWENYHKESNEVAKQKRI